MLAIGLCKAAVRNTQDTHTDEVSTAVRENTRCDNNQCVSTERVSKLLFPGRLLLRFVIFCTSNDDVRDVCDLQSERPE